LPYPLCYLDRYTVAYCSQCNQRHHRCIISRNGPRRAVSTGVAG
jgi:hypothetical protein